MKWFVYTRWVLVPIFISFSYPRVSYVSELIQHFSKYSNIFAFEVMNEMNKIGDLFDSQSKEITMNWFESTALCIREINSDVLITGSLYGDEVWLELNVSKYNDFIQIHTYEYEMSPEKNSKLIEKYILENLKFNKPVVVTKFATKKRNSKRLEFIRKGVQSGLNAGGSAFLYASVWDSDKKFGMGHGDMNEEIFGIFKETAPK